MSFELYQLFFVGIGYLLFLFGIAHVTERGLIPEKVINHPATYVLSLGVFASAWSIYGAVGLAHEYGYGFLSYYLGIAAAFIFLPLLLSPLLRISRIYLHSSLADILTYRYHTQWAGTLITGFMLLAILPLLALQIQAVSDSVHILTSAGNYDFSPNARHDELAITFCVAICLFTISFGSKHLTAHERHNGLVAAIATESIIKIFTMLVIGLTAIFAVFNGFDGLDLWLENNPQIVSLLNHPMRDDSARTLLLIFFASAVAMPHMFHMIFAENPNPKALQTASWGMPLLLLLMSIPILPILWAGFKLETIIPPEYFTLAIGVELDSSPLGILTYIGGLSAASGAVIVSTLALASMTLKHIILPIYRPSTRRDIYRWLLWIRRSLIIFIIVTGYVFFTFIDQRETLTQLGLAAFIASLQFLPGVMAALYWQGANRNGFIAGLIAGFSVWLTTLLLPLISNFQISFIQNSFFTLNTDDLWGTVTIISLGINVVVFVFISLITRTSEKEKTAAEVCATDDLNRPTLRILSVQNPDQMKEQLASALGTRTAQREVDRALKEMKLPSNETRPFALRRLRYRIEANLSGLLGPSVAHHMVDKLLPYYTDDNRTEDINYIEVQLENYKVHLTGLAADLDNLRRYHRQTLQDLPVGVCALGKDREVVMWNDTISELTNIKTFDVIGSYLKSIPAPWSKLLNNFIDSPDEHLYKQKLILGDEARWFNLHKAKSDNNSRLQGRVIVLEDVTDVHLLEDELLHSERLASIGRLAAGVAHEIGNPITGIACLAQNLKYDTENPDSLETAQEILAQTDRISNIVQTLVNFSHSGTDNSTTELQAVHLHGCVAEAINLLQLNKNARDVAFENHCNDNNYVLGDSQRLLQVFVNLLSNARDASPEGSPITITCELINQQWQIAVTDRGTGISKEHQSKIFDPFFTTKEAGDGTGLGLSLVYSIMEDLKGSIDVESPADAIHGGTRFILKLGQAPNS